MSSHLLNELKPGIIFEQRYQLLELVGTGGFGTVFKARQLDLNRDVAVKILHEEASEDAEDFARLKREAQILSRLTHPNVVQIYSFGLSNTNHPYLIEEFVEGLSLRGLLNSADRVPIERTLAIFRDAALALAYLHQQGVVHRDIKPENIFLCDKPAADTVKLIDFGLAKQKAQDNETLTKTGMLLGTADYMSPEQGKGQRAVPASDIYSLTACLYEMLTGSQLFSADTAIGLIYKHVSETPPRLDKSLLENCSILDEVMKKGLAKSVETRYANAESLAADLERAIEILAAKKDKRSLTPSLKTTSLLLPAIVLVLVLSAVGLWSSQQQDSKRIEAALSLPPDKAINSLIAAMEAEASPGQSEPVYRILNMAAKSAAYKHWSNDDQEELSLRSFLLLERLGVDNKKLVSLVIDNLSTTVRNFKNEFKRGVAQPSRANRVELYSRFLLRNPTDRKAMQRLYELSALRAIREDGYSDPAAFAFGNQAFDLLLSRSILRQCGPGDEDRCRLAMKTYLRTAEAALVKQDWKVLKQAMDELLNSKLRDENESAAAHAHLVTYYYACGDISTAKKELAIALKDVDRLGSTRTKAAVYEQACKIASIDHRWNECIAFARKRLEICRQDVDTQRLREAHDRLVLYLVAAGEVKSALKQIREASDDLSESPQDLLNFYFDLCGYREVLEQPELITEIYREHGQLAGMQMSPESIVSNAYICSRRERWLADTGTDRKMHLDKARQALDKAASSVDELDRGVLLQTYYSESAVVAQLQNDLVGTLRNAQKLLDYGRSIGSGMACRDALVFMFRVHLMRKDLAAAHKLVYAAIKELGNHPADLCRFYFETTYHTNLDNYPDLENELCTANRKLATSIAGNLDLILADYALAAHLRKAAAKSKEPKVLLLQAEDLLNEASKLTGSGIECHWAQADLQREKDSLAECMKRI